VNIAMEEKPVGVENEISQLDGIDKQNPGT
jgi:hypothetical protein